MAAKRHWTRRIIEYARGQRINIKRWSSVTVHRNSQLTMGLEVVNQWTGQIDINNLHVGDNWLKENFPYQYAAFLGGLVRMKTMSQFIQNNRITIQEWADQSPEEIDEAERKREKRYGLAQKKAARESKTTAGKRKRGDMNISICERGCGATSQQPGSDILRIKVRTMRIATGPRGPSDESYNDIGDIEVCKACRDEIQQTIQKLLTPRKIEVAVRSGPSVIHAFENAQQLLQAAQERMRANRKD